MNPVQTQDPRFQRIFPGLALCTSEPSANVIISSPIKLQYENEAVIVSAYQHTWCPRTMNNSIKTN